MSFSASAADERVLDVQLTDDTLTVSLRYRRVISVPLVWYPLLLNATAAQRENWKSAGGSYGIHWPEIDEDLSTEVCCVAHLHLGRQFARDKFAGCVV